MSGDLVPQEVYTSPDFPAGKKFEPGDGPHSTYGITTRISDRVINAGGEDRDKPSAAKDTPLGHLRAHLTAVQDKVNIFLTERIDRQREEEKESSEKFEQKLLDVGVQDEDDESSAE